MSIVNDAHVNERYPAQGLSQPAIYMMTITPLLQLEDLKFFLGIALTLPISPGEANNKYADLTFYLVPGDQGTQ
jgi:hypothetical protein